MRNGMYINDSLHGLVPLSEYEKKIISDVGFNRLHDIYQNSTAYLTFPSNRTKRFEHSIGTMKLCSDMFFYSILNASDDTLKNFFSIFRDEYEAIINNFSSDYCNTHLVMKKPRELPNKIPLNSWQYSLIPYNVVNDEKNIYFILIEALRVAALLHDIGHPPFSHVIENALKTVYNEYENNMKNDFNSAKQYFIKILSPYVSDNHQLHEEMGREISKSILEGILLSLPNNSSTDERLFYSLVQESVKRILEDKTPFSYLHRLIDSSLDGDRLDYVTRDPMNSGINAGTIDYSRIINNMMLIMPSRNDDDEERIIFCVPLKSVNAVEDFIRRRYNVYKDIIHHHRVIKTDCLLEYTVRDLIKDYLEHPPENFAPEDSTILPFDISGLWSALRDVPIIDKSYDLSQWNDSWLMTVLKKIYYEKYCNNTLSKDNVLKSRLLELLLNQKRYYSLIKRSEDFIILDDAVKNSFYNAQDDLNDKISSLSKDEYDEHKKLWKKRLCDFVTEILEISNPNIQKKSFIMSSIYAHYQLFCESKDFKGILPSFGKYVENIITNIVDKNSLKNVKDCIVCPKPLYAGIKQPIYFYGKYKGENTYNIFTLTEVSNLKNSLDIASHYLPIFYIYLLLDNELEANEKQNFLKKIGEEIGRDLNKKISFLFYSFSFQ